MSSRRSSLRCRRNRRSASSLRFTCIFTAATIAMMTHREKTIPSMVSVLAGMRILEAVPSLVVMSWRVGAAGAWSREAGLAAGEGLPAPSCDGVWAPSRLRPPVWRSGHQT